ncbi:CHAT domain-containing protein [Rhodococcus sp. BP-241]|uniref:CHAT domain-containing protein n=1 Tax=Rhodococcus sp. BP-241 TaxID=2739441 RepID=UPI001C9A7D67|nr:CHAT domain-containing protein [Rhodococcus sp. BP-241]MBY6707222.1 CHAT domain-containing protein [Rhodococcus sp. BP-241]
MTESARALCDTALALISAGRHDDARRLLVRAESLEPDGVVRADVIAAATWVMVETGELAGARERCRRELGDHDAGRTDLGPGGRAVVLARLAAIEVRAGNDDLALTLFAGAVGDLGDLPAARGRTLINRAYVLLRRRELVAAATDLDRAADAFAEVGDDVELAKVTHNRGYVDLLAGDLAGALDRMTTARLTLRHLSAAHRAVCDLDRAEVLEAAGMVGDAVDTLTEVLALLESTSEWHTRAEAELALARLVAVDDPGRAARLADDAARHFRDHGSEVSAVRADAIGMRVRLVAGTEPASVAAAESLASRLDGEHLTSEAADLRVRVALRLLDTDGPDASEDYAQRIDVRPDAPVPTRLLDAQYRAEVARRRGDPRSALRRVAAVMDDFIDWQTHFGSLGLQVATQHRVREVLVQGMTSAWETGDPHEVLAWSERARGAAAAWNPVGAPRDPRVSVALAELRSLRDSSDHARVTELHRWVRDLGWTGSRPGPVDRPGLDDARSALQSAGADLVTYLWLRDRVVALTVTESGPRLHDLGPWADLDAVVAGLPADLDLAAADLGASLAAGVATSLRRRLARLDAMLVEPLDELGRRRVLLTVPGVLGGVPWAMLPSFAGRSLSSAVSVGWWMGSAGTQRWSGPAAVISGPGTDHGEREAASVADAWSGTCVVGAEATTERASALAAESATLHVTAHGGLSREHPLFSSMRLADGPWFGHDVCQLPQVPSLVVVSACEMGRAVGEYDTLGMARAWLHAGARCVVAAPANIDDARAADVLPRIHRRIAAGVTPADALVPEFADGLHGTGVPILCYGNGW